MRTLHAATIIALFVLIEAPTLARADRVTAGRLFRAGQEAADKREYLTAIRAFEASNRALHHPNTDFALAQARRQQHGVDHDIAHVRAAIDLYRGYMKARPRSPWTATAQAHLVQMLAVAARHPDGAAPREPRPTPTEIIVTSRTPQARIYLESAGGQGTGVRSPAILVLKPGDHRFRVEAPGHTPQTRTVKAIASRLVVAEVELERLPGAIRVMGGAPGARVYVDGRLVGNTPYEGGGHKAGVHRVALSRRGRALWQGEVKVASDRTSLVLAELELTSQRKAAWLVAAGSGALAAAGVITGALALDANTVLKTMPTGDNPERAARDDELARRDSLATVSTGLLIGAAAAFVAAAGLYWFDAPGAPAQRGPAPTHGRAALLGLALDDTRSER